MIDYTKNPIGEFTEKDYGKSFTYVNTISMWALDHDLPHEIHMSDGTTRFAEVKKTVAYVSVDEDEYGKPVLEKWYIKGHKVF